MIKRFSVNENIELSSSLKSKLLSIKDNKVANYLLSVDGKESAFNKIDLDIDKSLIKISDDRAKDKLYSIKIGRVIRKILSEFSFEFNEKDIEEFVNRFKSELDNLEIKILKGNDIIEGYRKSNYANLEDKDIHSSLYSSCMTDHIDYLDLYTKNKCCSLVILEESGKIKSRALLWNAIIDGKEKTFLDRIYSLEQKYDSKLKSWALNNDYLVTINNKSDGYINKFEDKNALIYREAKIYLENFDLSKYPYVDTLTYQYNNMITNNSNIVPTDKKSYLLQSTKGIREVYGMEMGNISFNIIKGEDIRKWYKSENYETSYGFNFTLVNKSLEDDILNFLVNETEVLVCLNEDNKLLGRAIIINTDLGRLFLEPDTLNLTITNKIIEYLFEESDIHRYDDGDDKVRTKEGKTYNKFIFKLKEKYEIEQFSIHSLYFNKTKNYISNINEKINGDEIYMIDFYHSYPTFKLVYKTPTTKSPIPWYDITKITFSEFDNKYYFTEDVTYAKLSIKTAKNILTHKLNTIEISTIRGINRIYKYDPSFNIDSFNDDAQKTKWLINTIIYIIPDNFINKNLDVFDVGHKWNILSDKEVSISLSHKKKKDYKRRWVVNKNSEFDINMNILIKPTNLRINFYVEEDKKLLLSISAKNFKDLIDNKRNEIFKYLDVLLEKIL
jgi:hypothetical protein